MPLIVFEFHSAYHGGIGFGLYRYIVLKISKCVIIFSLKTAVKSKWILRLYDNSYNKYIPSIINSNGKKLKSF